MKHLRRCFCVLLCFVLLLGVSSGSVNAAELDIKPYHFYASSQIHYGNVTYSTIGTQVYYPGNGEIENSQHTIQLDTSVISQYGSAFNVLHQDIAYDDGTILFEKDIKTTLRLENIYHKYLLSCTVHDVNGELTYFEYYDDVFQVNVEVRYMDGSLDWLAGEYSIKDGNLSVKTTFTPKDDVVSLRYTIFTNIPYDGHLGHVVGITTYLGEFDGDNKYNLTIQQPSEEAGLLSGIWGAITDGFSALGDKVTNLWTAITDGFTNMGQKLTDVFNSIVELPAKLWGLIENGLKSLFVPDEQVIADYKDKFELLFEDKLGAVWQVVDITLESWDNINSSNITDTITIPEVTIPLPANESFSFGGQSVKVVPDGFQFLADLCKTASAMFCTLMFINGLRKRYDEVMGVEQ